MKYIWPMILFLMVACGDQNFKKVEKLGEFRILSVFTTTPEVVPGAGVTLQLFVSDVAAGGRIINGTTISCIDPGISFGARANCDHDPSAVTDTYTVDTTTADMTSNLFTGLTADTLSVTVPAGIFLGRSTREQFNGVSYIVIFTFEVDGKEVSVFRRIVATNKVALNTNPSGSFILLNGVAINSTPNEDDKLRLTSSAPETYDYKTIDGSIETRSEDFQVAWFVTEGKLDKPKSGVSETVKYLGETATDPSLVVAIVRDERGGVEIVREFFP